jgi:hypothetical protein
LRPGDFVVGFERDEYAEAHCIPFDEDDAEHAHRSGRCLAELIDQAFPNGVADHVIAGLVAARLTTQLDASEVHDPDFELTLGAQADISPLNQALVPALGDIGIDLRFDDV